MVESFIFLTDLCFLKGTNSAKEKKNQIIMTWLVYNKLLCMHVCVCVCVGVHACTGTVHTTISMWRNVLFIILGSTLMIEIQ